jgi:hypothetical protein
MTKYLKLLMAGFVGLVLISPALAVECEIETQANLVAMIDRAKETGATTKTLTKGEVNEILEKIGRPPNAAEEGDLTVYRVDMGGVAALFFAQGGCFINRIGPIPVDLLNLKLGITSAGEKID